MQVVMLSWRFDVEVIYSLCLLVTRFNFNFVGNLVPNVSLSDHPNIVDGTLQVQIGIEIQITVYAIDPDMDTITFSLSNDSSIQQPDGVTIDNSKNKEIKIF